MSERARLTALELEAFRGFASPRQLDLDADTVLLRGDNGTGKTSISDGIYWLLTGELDYLAERVKGLRASVDVALNAYRAAQGVTESRVRLQVSKGARNWTFERIGGHRENQLRGWLNGEQLGDPRETLAQVFDHADYNSLAAAVRRWGVLQQHALSTSLDQTAASLHERFSAILGLEDVTRFAAATKTAFDEVIRERTRLRRVQEDLRGKLDASERRLQDLASESISEDSSEIIARGLASISTSLPAGVRLDADGVKDLDSLVRLGTYVRELQEAAESVARLTGQTDLARQGLQDPAALSKAVSAAERDIRETQDATTTATLLAESALKLLSDHCPVCAQAIDAKEVARRLVALRDEAIANREQMTRARMSLEHAQQALASAQVAHQRYVSVNEELQAARLHLRDVISRGHNLSLSLDSIDASDVRALSGTLSELRTELRDLYENARVAASGVIERATSEVTSLRHEYLRGQADLEVLEVRYSSASRLNKAAHRAAEQIVAQALDLLAPAFAEVFDRLAPHPTFSKLALKQDTYYGKNQMIPEVSDPITGVSGNPRTVLSEGQSNVVALSYFVGMALNVNEGKLPFLVFDDPLQSLDVVSVLGFADLCRRLRERRQLIITTHDRRFADLLDRKLAPRESTGRLVIHDFHAWSADGPTIMTRDEAAAEAIPYLRSAG